MFKNNINEKKIRKFLKTRRMGDKMLIFPKCDSTNTLAKKLDMYPDGTLIAAKVQTRGKGRMGRKWVSDKGGIYMSLLLKPPVDTETASQITLVAAMAVCKTIGRNAKIKWPNDIVLNGRKVCGILTECTRGNIICGIGINVNNKKFPDDLPYATSLRINTRYSHSKNEIIAEFLNQFELLYDRFLNNGFTDLKDEYFKMCVNVNCRVRIIQDGKEIVGMARGIADNGGLIVRRGNEEMCITSGEVSVRGYYGYV